MENSINPSPTNVSPSFHTPHKVFAVIFFLLIVVGTSTAIFLSQQKQDIRQKAAPITIQSAENYFAYYDALNSQNQDYIIVANPNTEDITASVVLYDKSGKVLEVKNLRVTSGRNSAVNFPSRQGGPVTVSTRFDNGNAATAIVTKRTLWGGTLTEVAGTPKEALAYAYYFPWYDSKNNTQVFIVVSNPNDSILKATIGFGKSGSQTIDVPGHGSNFAKMDNIQDGPVQVKTTAPAIVSQRTLWKGKSLSEIAGIAENTFHSVHMFPWYDSIGSKNQDWILIGNLNNGEVKAKISIQNVGLAPDVIIPSGSTKYFNVPNTKGGPVTVHTTYTKDGTNYDGKSFKAGDDAWVVTSQRTLWEDTLSEATGQPLVSNGKSTIANNNFYAHYDARSVAGGQNYIMVSNPGDLVGSSQNVSAVVYFMNPDGKGGYTQSLIKDIAPKETKYVSFPGKIGGPILVSGTYNNDGSNPGSAPIFSSSRTLWGGKYLSEVMSEYQTSTFPKDLIAKLGTGTPTNTPTGSPTATPTPILPTKEKLPTSVIFNFGFDNLSDVPNYKPIHGTRDVTVCFYKPTDDPATLDANGGCDKALFKKNMPFTSETVSGKVQFSNKNNPLMLDENLMQNLFDLNYQVQMLIKTDGTLRRRVGTTVQTIIPETVNTISPVDLVLGDVNNDNIVDIYDYNIVATCRLTTEEGDTCRKKYFTKDTATYATNTADVDDSSDPKSADDGKTVPNVSNADLLLLTIAFKDKHGD